MTILHSAVERALAGILAELGLGAIPARLVACPRPDLGDAAVQAPLAGARILRRPPMAIAGEVAARLSGLPEIASAEPCAPGYVNLRFSDMAIAATLAAQSADPACGVTPAADAGRVVIDFGGPNVGKQMHVGHLRAFVLGESLRRMLSAVGHDVVSDIHLGDWGLPAAMVVDELDLRGLAGPWLAPVPGASPPGLAPIGEEELATLYPTAASACRDDAGRMARARAVAARMQAGDAGPLALWGSVVALAKGPIRRTCARLGARFDLFLGEADVQDEIPALLDRLLESGVARRDGEAIVVDLAEPGDAKPMPALVLAKADGASLYATSDIATIVRRVRELSPGRILYVVDERQGLHFRQVFRTAAKAGLAPGVRFEHVGFGTVNGSDGRPFRTRDGATMPLSDLLDAAKAKAWQALREAPGLDRDEAAERIGLAALRIADLSSHRLTGYPLDLDQALRFEGRTGPYLLYALVRLRSVLAKAGGEAGPVAFAHPAERELALACLGFDAALHRAVDALAPHELVAYAFELAGALGRFYVSCPVASEAEEPVRRSRIALCRAAEAAMARCWDLLGLEAPAAM